MNTFERRPARPKAKRTLERDLIAGDLSGDSIWFNVHPAIADFLSDEVSAIEERKGEIGEWERLETLSASYLKRFANVCRDGNPYLSHLPGRAIALRGARLCNRRAS